MCYFILLNTTFNSYLQQLQLLFAVTHNFKHTKIKINFTNTKQHSHQITYPKYLSDNKNTNTIIIYSSNSTVYSQLIMSLCTIRFQITCQTKLGQVVYICGNTPQLGNWKPQNAMRLYTDSALYPKWDPYKSIFVRQGNKLLFKLCIMDQNHNTRWQSIPHNRQIIPNQNFLVQFTAHYQQITLTPIVQQIIKPPRKKTCDILNELQSDGSSSHEYWKQFMSEEEEESILYITLMTQMRRIIEYGTQQQFSNYEQQKFALVNSKQFDNVLRGKIERVRESIQSMSHLYCIVDREQQAQRDNKGQDNSNKIWRQDRNRQKDQIVSYMGQDSYIVERSQFINSYSIHNHQLPVIFHIQNININSLDSDMLNEVFECIFRLISAQNKLLSQKEHKLQYYLSINLTIQPTSDLVDLLIKKKVSLVIVQQQRTLQKLLDLLVEKGNNYHSLDDDLLAVQLQLMAIMLIKLYQSKSKHISISTLIDQKQNNITNIIANSTTNANTINSNRQHHQKITTYFTQIKKTLLTHSNKSYLHLGTNQFIQSLKEDDIFLGLGYHKKNILLINADSLETLTPKILTQIIALSSKPNFQIIIILNKLNTDIKAKFPASKTNKLVVIGKNGLLYANQNVLIDLVSSLSLQKGKFCQYITKIVDSITMGLQTKTQPNTSLIQSELVFKGTSLGKLGLTLVRNKIKQHNQNNSHYKLTLQSITQTTYKLKPYIFTQQFYLRAIFQNISKQVHDQRAFLLSVNFKNDNNYMHKMCNVFQKVFKSKQNIKLRNMQIIGDNQIQYSFIAMQEILTKQQFQGQLQYLCEHFLGSSGIKSYHLNILSPQQKQHRRSFADKQLKQKHFDYSHDKL